MICTKCKFPNKDFYLKNNKPIQPCKDCKIKSVRAIQDEYYKEIVKERNRQKTLLKREQRKRITAETKWASNLVAGLRKRGRKERGKKIEVDLAVNKEFVVALAMKQGFKCYYSGLQMEIGHNFKMPSLDRVDSEKGYLKTNVVLCCKALNYAKSEYSEEEFRRFLLELKLFN